MNRDSRQDKAMSRIGKDLMGCDQTVSQKLVLSPEKSVPDRGARRYSIVCRAVKVKLVLR